VLHGHTVGLFDGSHDALGQLLELFMGSDDLSPSSFVNPDPLLIVIAAEYIRR
jgi:hypothetical protein